MKTINVKIVNVSSGEYLQCQRSGFTDLNATLAALPGVVNTLLGVWTSSFGGLPNDPITIVIS